MDNGPENGDKFEDQRFFMAKSQQKEVQDDYLTQKTKIYFQKKIHIPEKDHDDFALCRIIHLEY